MKGNFRSKTFLILILYAITFGIPTLIFASSVSKIKWIYDIFNHSDQSAYIKAGPIVGRDGTLYIATTNNDHLGRLIAITSEGKKKWEYDNNGALFASMSLPAVAIDGTVYVTNEDTLYAINGQGKLKWSRYLGKDQIRTRIILDNKGLLLIGRNNTLYAYDVNGDEKWQFTNDLGQFYLQPAFAADGTIYASTPMVLYALDHNGKLKWNVARTYSSLSSPTIATDGSIYLVDPMALLAVNPNGTKKWLVEIDTFAMDASQVQYSPSVGKDGTIYFDAYDLYQDRRLFAVTSQGKVKWKGPLLAEDNNAYLARSPVIAPDGTISLLVSRYYENDKMNKIMIVNEDGSIKTPNFDLSEGPKFLSIGLDGTFYTSNVKTPNLLYAIGP